MRDKPKLNAPVGGIGDVRDARQSVTGDIVLASVPEQDLFDPRAAQIVEDGLVLFAEQTNDDLAVGE